MRSTATCAAGQQEQKGNMNRALGAARQHENAPEHHQQQGEMKQQGKKSIRAT
jgi:hypothetical protein